MSDGWPGAWRAAVPAIVVSLATIAGCGSDGAAPTLPAEAAEGREIARTNGCAACHGSNGEGGVGPEFAGLYGSQVTLADGTTVLADEAYLTEAIRTPGATKVAGYDIGMPENDLDDAQIAAIVAYIRALDDTAVDT
jgi:cytochrome c oxidase subunit 2